MQNSFSCGMRSLNGGKSALHVAIENQQEEVFWLHSLGKQCSPRNCSRKP